MPRLLVVDDEPACLKIIGKYLEDEPYELVFAGDGEEAWKTLECAPAAFDCVLLDRMMPALDGIGLLKRIRADERMRLLPVVMQTAAATSEQIAESVRHGACYHLSKPYEQEMLVSILRAALDSRRDQVEILDIAKDKRGELRLLSEASFEFATLQEARLLAVALASECENTSAVTLGLTELLVNAVEHGNLGVGYAAKTRLLAEDAWAGEIERRLALPENADRRVRVRFERRTSHVAITITDCGRGFDWTEYLQLNAKRAFDSHGRGIALARQLAFTTLEYSGSGNTVTVTAPLRESR